MTLRNSKSARFQDDIETVESTPLKEQSGSFVNNAKIDGKGTRRELTRVFSEDYELVQRKVLDPRGPVINRWNKCFLVACLISLFVDPLFFFLPVVGEDVCMQVTTPLKIALTVIRTVVDAFYVIQIYVRFRTAYVAPSSRVYGRGELVIDPSKISRRYLRTSFWIDLVATLSLPQVLIWLVIPHLRGSDINVKIVLRFVIIFQFLLRLCLIFPLSSRIIKANGVLMGTPWAGAAYNLVLYMLASHVLGSCWYLLAIEQQEQCWKDVCRLEPDCQYLYFDCRTVGHSGRDAWFKSSNISNLCSSSSEFFQFGIYGDALTFEITMTKFLNKYFYCLWWGLRNLSSAAQNLETSTYISEINFAIAIAIVGLVLFALLIGNMETYLQSTSIRLEEWRVKRVDTEKWMRRRQLPHELRKRVRNYDQYRWVSTRGVDEEALLQELPLDLRRDIKRHICLDLIRRVPMFDEMDEQMLDAICERLKPVLCTPATCLVREGDPVTEMLFIIRGYLDSFTTGGGRTGFFNSSSIGPGDFCGEELLTWALDPRPSIVLPTSTRTVKAISGVEAFALVAEDVNFVASQFRKLHSKQLRHKFRYYSHQWRTWAACFIQSAWFRYKRRKEAAQLKAKESTTAPLLEPVNETMDTVSALPSGFSMYAVKVKLAASTRASGSRRSAADLDRLKSVRKPVEPDFPE